MKQVNQGSFKKKLLAMAVLAPAMAITACSNDGAYVPGSASDEVGFKVYDGYLVGATACVDLNLNKQCDADEPQTTTTEGGVAIINGLTAAQKKFPLVVKAVPGQTIDEDTGASVPSAFTYAGPAGSRTVSAFSTIIQIEAERLISEGASPADAVNTAKANLAAALGVTGEDLTNFDAPAIADEVTGNQSETAARLHLVNRVLTANLVKATESAQTVDSNPANFSAVLYAAVNKVTEQVAAVKTAVDTKVASSGVSAVDLAEEDLSNLVAEAVTENVPEDVIAEDVSDAKAAVKAAQDAILAAIEEETGEDQPAPQAPTGATGGSDGGTQGAA